MPRIIKISQEVIGKIINDAIEVANIVILGIAELEGIIDTIISMGQMPEISSVMFDEIGFHYIRIFHDLVRKYDPQNAKKLTRTYTGNRLSYNVFTTEDFKPVRCAVFLLESACTSRPVTMFRAEFQVDDQTKVVFDTIMEIIRTYFTCAVICLTFGIRMPVGLKNSPEFQALKEFMLRRAWVRLLNEPERENLNHLVGQVARWLAELPQ